MIRSIRHATLFLTALSCSVSSAYAASVDVYGRIDMGLHYVANQGDAKDHIEMKSGTTAGSRFGIKGREQIDGTTAISFILESGIDTDTGNYRSDRLFGRQSTLALETAWGTLAFGRAGTIISGADSFNRLGGLHAFGATWADAGFQLQGTASRMDNAVFYVSPTKGGWTLNANYSLQSAGNEEPDFHDNKRYGALAIDYKKGNLKWLLGTDHTFYADSVKYKDTYSVITGIGWTVGDVKLFGLYQYANHTRKFGRLDAAGDLITKISAATGTSKLLGGLKQHYLGVGAETKVGGGRLKLGAQYLVASYNDKKDIAANKADKGAYWSVAGAYIYPLSRRTSVYGLATWRQGEKGLKGATDGTDDVKRATFSTGMVHRF